MRPFIALLALAYAVGPAIAEQSPADVTTLLNHAESLAAQGRHKQAAEAFQQASRQAPDAESIRFRLASQLVFQRHFDEAEAIYRILSGSANTSMAGLAKSSLDALEAERKRAAEQKSRQDAFQARDASQKRAQLERERVFRAKEADQKARQAIYDLFTAGRDREGLAQLDTYAKNVPTVPPELQFSGVFAMQRMGKFREAGERLDAMPDGVKSSAGWLLANGRNERALGRNTPAWQAFSAASTAAQGTPLEPEIRREIKALPAEANLDRWAWGELQLDTLYMTRFSDAIAYGQVREGTFVPGARWIQPFVQLDFTLDTKSEVGGGISQVYANNLAGGHAGVRIRLIPNQEIWLYGLLGAEKDLRATTRFHGAWFIDWRTGIRGYKGLGPGLNFLKESSFFSPLAPRWDIRPRLAWFVEGGGDAAYYSLYENFIAYGQMRQGFRVLEAGGWLAFDTYALEQGTVDSLGLYYNNFIEAGAGLRTTARLQRSTSLIARVEYLGGAYAGTNAQNSRGTLPGTYQDLRITVSLWSEW